MMETCHLMGAAKRGLSAVWVSLMGDELLEALREDSYKQANALLWAWGPWWGQEGWEASVAAEEGRSRSFQAWKVTLRMLAIILRAEEPSEPSEGL